MRGEWGGPVGWPLAGAEFAAQLRTRHRGPLGGREESMCLAIPGKIASLENSDPVLRSGRVDFGGIVKLVNLACVPEASVGDYVLVHAGMAISTVDEEEAQQVFQYLRQMGELEELDPRQDPTQ